MKDFVLRKLNLCFLAQYRGPKDSLSLNGLLSQSAAVAANEVCSHLRGQEGARRSTAGSDRYRRAGGGGPAFFWSELTPLGAQPANHLPSQLCGGFITIPMSLCFRGISQVGFTSSNPEAKALGISPPILFKM